MLRDSVETSNKYFKVLYGPLDHVFHITLHNRPYKNFVLFDENFRQIRRIDLSDVSSFQTRCIHSESTVHLRSRKQKTLTTKYLLEIYFGTTNRNPLTFTTVSFKDSQTLCSEIEKTFGVRVYNYGSLNAAFKNALKNAEDKEFITETHESFVNKLEKYQLYKDAHDLSHLIQLAHFDEEDHEEPEAEVTSKYPVVIEGNMEDGSFICYRDFRNNNFVSTSVYKVEWYLSKSVGSNEEFFQIPSDSSDTFYLTEYMIGHFVMVKVYRAEKFNENRTFLYSTAIRGPVYPNNMLCHHILLNSSRKSDFHEGLMSTLDLDVLFSIVDSKNKFGKYQPFHPHDVVNNFQYFQHYLNEVKPEPKRENVNQNNKLKNKQNVVLNQTKNEVLPESENEEDHNDTCSNDVLDQKKMKSQEYHYDIENSIYNKEENVDNDNAEIFHSQNQEDDYLTKISVGVLDDSKEEENSNRYNKIKLKLPSKKLNWKDLEEDEAENEEEYQNKVDYNDLSEEDKYSWNFLKGSDNKETKDLHDVATVSDLSESDQVKTFDPDEYFKEQPKKKKFSIFNLFRSDPNKKQQKMKKQMEQNKQVRFDKKNLKNNKRQKKKCFYNRKQNLEQRPLLDNQDKTEESIEQSEESEQTEMENELRMNVANEDPKEKLPGKNKIKDNKKNKEKPPKPKRIIMNRRNYKKLQAERAKRALEQQPLIPPNEGESVEPKESQVHEEPINSQEVKEECELPKKTLFRKNKNQDPKFKKIKNKNKPDSKTNNGDIYNDNNKNTVNSPKNMLKENKGPKSPKNRRLPQQNTPKNSQMKQNRSKFKGKESSSRRNTRKQKQEEQLEPQAPVEQQEQKVKGRVEKKKKAKGFRFGFGKFNKGPQHKGTTVTPPHNPQNELQPKKDERQETLEKFLKYVDTIQNVPVKIKICLNELVITFGLSSLNLKWKMVDLEKEDQLELEQFPCIKKQLDTSVTIVYKSDIPIRIKIRTTSTFQRNVIYHSIIFNKYRNNYSLDRCDRELQSGYYNGLKTAYTRVCRALYEDRRRHQDQINQQRSPEEVQYNQEYVKT